MWNKNPIHLRLFNKLECLKERENLLWMKKDFEELKSGKKSPKLIDNLLTISKNSK